MSFWGALLGVLLPRRALTMPHPDLIQETNPVFIFFFRFMYLFERGRARALEHSGEGRQEMERETQADSMLSKEPAMGLELPTLRPHLS